MPVIEVSDLRKRYGERVAVDDVSFTVERGEIFGILGPNGAGKTTTVECVEGLRRPDSGTISVLGLDPRRAMEDLVTLDVRDNGIDIARVPADADGFGLTAMRQRLSRVAGELEIESEPGVGTAVSARVPVS